MKAEGAEILRQAGDPSSGPVVGQGGPRPGYLGLKALARYLALSERHLRSLLGRGLPHFRIGAPGVNGRRGARLLFRQSEVDRWLECFRVRQAAPVDLDAILLEAMRDVKGISGNRRGERGRRVARQVAPTLRKRARTRTRTRVTRGGGGGGGG